jgi:hypothetical protein
LGENRRLIRTVGGRISQIRDNDRP